MANVILDSNPPSIRKAFASAWMMFEKRSGLFTAFMLTFFASWAILELIVVAGQRFGFLLWVIAHLSFFILFAGMEIAFIRICLASHDGKQIRYLDIFRELHPGIHFLFVQLLYFVMILAGFALLVVPGAYLGAKYAMYAFHFADGHSNLEQSFQQSAVTSRGSLWFLFRLSVFIILLNIAGASILGIGLIVTVPLSVLMKTSIYCQLRDSRR